MNTTNGLCGWNTTFNLLSSYRPEDPDALGAPTAGYDESVLSKEDEPKLQEDSCNLFKAAVTERDEKGTLRPGFLVTTKDEEAQRSSDQQFCINLKPRKKTLLSKKIKKHSKMRDITLRQAALLDLLIERCGRELPKAILKEWLDDPLLSNEQKGAFCLDAFWSYVAEEHPAKLVEFQQAWIATMHFKELDASVLEKKRALAEAPNKYEILKQSFQPIAVEEMRCNHEVYCALLKEIHKNFTERFQDSSEATKLDEMSCAFDAQFLQARTLDWDAFFKLIIGEEKNKYNLSDTQLEVLRKVFLSPKDFIDRLNNVKGKPFYLNNFLDVKLVLARREFYKTSAAAGISYSDIGKARCISDKEIKTLEEELAKGVQNRNEAVEKAYASFSKDASFDLVSKEFISDCIDKTIPLLLNLCEEYRLHSETRFLNLLDSQKKFLTNINYLFTEFSKFYNDQTVSLIKGKVKDALRKTTKKINETSNAPGSLNFYRNKRIIMPKHTCGQKKECKQILALNIKILKYCFEENLFASMFNKLEDAHTAPFPGLYSWDFTHLAKQIRTVVPEDQDQNNHNYYKLKLSKLLDSEKCELELFKEFIEKIRDKLTRPDNPRINHFVQKSLYAGMLVALKNASQVQHIYAYNNHILDFDSEVNLDEIVDIPMKSHIESCKAQGLKVSETAPPIKKTSYKSCIANAAIELLNQTGPVSTWDVWKSQRTYFSKLKRNVNGKIKSLPSKEFNTIEEIIHLHGLYSIKRGFLGSKLNARKSMPAASANQPSSRPFMVKNSSEPKVNKLEKCVQRLILQRDGIKLTKRGRVRRNNLTAQIHALQGTLVQLKG